MSESSYGACPARAAGSTHQRTRDPSTQNSLPSGSAKNNPGLLALSNVRSRGSECEQSLDLGVSVVGSEVEVQAILRRLRLRDGHEKESRKPIRGGSDLELVGVVVHDNPAERVSPPESEGTRVARIDDRLLPLEAHNAIVDELLPAVPRRARSASASDDRMAACSSALPFAIE